MDSQSLPEGRSWYLLFKTWDESEEVLLASLSMILFRPLERHVPQVGLQSWLEFEFDCTVHFIFKLHK